MENRKNKTVDEIAALECIKKDNLSKVMIIYVICLILLIIGSIIGILYTDNEDALLILLPSLIFISVIIVININSLVNRNFNKLIERIARFTDLYLSEYRSKFAIKFNGSNIGDYDFAKNFIHYANQNSNEFEEKWAAIKSFTIIEKIKKNLILLIFLLIIFGIPIFLVFKNSNITLKGLVYKELRKSQYTVIDQQYVDDNKITVTIKYTVNGKKYITDVEIEGKCTWMVYGGLYYKKNNPEKIIYIEN